jgi:endoribonuclease LACTB2
MLKVSQHGSVARLSMARAPLGRPLRVVHAYLIDGLLVDSGPPATAAKLVAWARHADIDRVVCTHHHEDHAGGAPALLRYLGLPVLGTRQAMALSVALPPVQLYRRVAWGRPENVELAPLGDHLPTRRSRLSVIPTPGHSPDHTCLFEPHEGWLFAGDLFVHEKVRYLRRDEDLPALVESLQRVLALSPRLLACAHAGIIPDAAEALRRKLTYWHELALAARPLHDAGLSSRQITRRLLGPEGPLTWLSSGHFAKRYLIEALLAIEPDRLLPRC